MSRDSRNSILVLGHEGRSIDFTTVFKILARHDNVDIRILTQAELKRLGRTLRRIDIDRYRHVVVDLPFRRVCASVRALRRLPGLVVYEEDACQNFIPASRWYGKFAEAYRQLPAAHFVLTGFATARRFAELGLNTHCIPKGFDPARLYTTGSERDIPAGFIGRVRSRVYSERAAVLEELAAKRGVQMLRTENLDQYRDLLNRIRIFVSADVSLGEYMAKNFEAMACGCTVLAWQQGDGEEEALGLKDGENIVLYRSAREALEKLDWLLREPETAQRIADAGRDLVERDLRHDQIAERLLRFVEALPAAPRRPRGRWASMKARLGLN